MYSSGVIVEWFDFAMTPDGVSAAFEGKGYLRVALEAGAQSGQVTGLLRTSRAQPCSAYSEVQIANFKSATKFDPIGALNDVALREQMGRRVAQGEERLRRALEELKQWKENSVSHADVAWLMSLSGVGGVMLGTAWADWRACNPNASEAQAGDPSANP